MREKEIEKILVDEVRGLGGRAYKWVSPGNDGVPDRIVIFPGQWPIFVELKADRGIVSPLQRAQIMWLRELGQPVQIVRGISGLAEFFELEGYLETAEKIAKRFGL